MNTNRYDRQIRLPGFGLEGQQLLSRARVLVVGAGGLGVPVCQYLNAMGVGTLGIVDKDIIEESNLHRQPLYAPGDCGKLKTAVLSSWLKTQNPETTVVVHNAFLEPENALQLLENYDLVVDATDRIAARYILDDACVIREIPWVYGALHGFEGQLSVFNFKNGPTYRCLYPKIPNPGEIPNCNQLGTLGVLPGIIGSMQALETIKILCGIGSVHSGKLILYNALDQQIRQISFDKNPEFEKRGILEPSQYDIALCPTGGGMSAAAYWKIWKSGKVGKLLDVREPEEFNDHNLSGSLNLPLSKLAKGWAGIDKTSDIYLICQSGSRSAQAYRILKDQNSDGNIHWIQGGIQEMKQVMRAKSNV